MDILLLQASAHELPTSRRVGVVVHDGATDARPWPGPGPDRELLGAYGPELGEALARERDKTAGAVLPIGGLLRLHPGRLHCDFFLWAATRAPEEEGRQAKAPDRATLEATVAAALDFAAERNVIRIAFPALGAGPDALPDADRLAIVARACHAWHEQRYAAGRASGIEEVLICDPRLGVVAAARRALAGVVKAPPPEPRPAAPPRAATKPKPTGTRAKGASTRKPRLDEAELGHARATARPWDRTTRYAAGDWFVHAKFGVGRVMEIAADGYATILFEDGEIRRLIHAR